MLLAFKPKLSVNSVRMGTIALLQLLRMLI
jgi:hypothetical protein